MWIIFGLVAGIFVITAIVVQTTIVLTRKTGKPTATTIIMKTTDKISSTKKGLSFGLQIF